MPNPSLDKNGELVSVGDYVRFVLCTTSSAVGDVIKIGKVVRIYESHTSRITYCKICGHGGFADKLLHYERRTSFTEKLTETEKTAFIIGYGEVYYD